MLAVPSLSYYYDRTIDKQTKAYIKMYLADLVYDLDPAFR